MSMLTLRCRTAAFLVVALALACPPGLPAQDKNAAAPARDDVNWKQGGS